jgi:hypothetical protein
MNFIRTIDGSWVNLDHVVRFKDAGKKGWILEGAQDGELLGITDVDPEAAGANIIPAAAGTMATVIEECDARDGGDKLTTFRYPIIAWQILTAIRGAFCATPILPESCFSERTTILLETPSGFVDLANCEYSTIEAALENVRESIKQREEIK